MDVVSLLRRARVAGLTVAAQDGKLVVEGPRRHEELARELGARKPDVLRALAQEKAAWLKDGCALTADLFRIRTVGDLVGGGSGDSVGEPCFACGGVARWRLRDGGEWICTTCHPPLPPRKDIETWTPGGSSDG